jgi:hypothetical protein
MNHNLNKAQQFLFFTAPIFTSLMMVVSPTQAATLALSGGLIGLNNFSHIPLKTQTFRNSNTLEIFSSESSGSAQAKTTAYFPINPPTAVSSSLSIAVGKGENYFGLAQSATKVIGDFFVNAGSSFSFNFMTELNLIAASDNPKTEKASASGNVSFLLLDITDKANQRLLDFFTVSGQVKTVDNKDFLKFEKSPNVNIAQNLRKSYFGDNEEFDLARVNGSVQRSFTTPTALTLIQVQTNEATVSTPEPSSTLALLILGGLSGIGLTASRQGGRLKPKRRLTSSKSTA